MDLSSIEIAVGRGIGERRGMMDDGGGIECSSWRFVSLP